MSDPHSTTGASGGPAILVVEDDETLRLAIKWALEELGAPVEIAADGQEAVDWLAARRPRLVLLDMGLPVVNGEGVAASLRDLYGTAVPVVVLTADGRAREKAERVGAVSYLHKPFEVDELLGKVREALAGGASS